MARAQRWRRREFRELVKTRMEGAEVVSDGEMRLMKYEVDGKFDYTLYKQAQVLGNKFKLDRQWVAEPHIEVLADYVKSLGLAPKTGICHGTRQGFEQSWFREHIDGQPDIFGTEISDTASQFPNTIEWDFHELKGEWIGKMDLIYSNSWDHAFDPKLALRNWARCLAPEGIMLLDHGEHCTVDGVTALDPFGISERGLIKLLGDECGDLGEVVDVVEDVTESCGTLRTIVFRASG